jgi:NADH-quinone oxidoreductase subunit M
MFQRSMHNAVGPKVKSFDIRFRDGLVLVPLVAVIIGLGVFPQLVLDRSEEATVQQIGPAVAVAER